MILGPVLTYTLSLAMQQRMDSRSAELVGAIIRDTTTKRIIGHVQPTRFIEQFGQVAGTGLGGIASPVSAVTGIGSIVQNEQIKGRLDAMAGMLGQVHALQLATLATSVVGVGVTAVSTALILSRLSGLETRAKETAEKLDRLAREQVYGPIRAAMADVRTQVQRYEEFPRRKSVDGVAHDVESTLHQSFNHLADGYKTLAGSEGVQSSDLVDVLAAMAVSGSVQVKVLLHIDELSVAEQRAGVLRDTLSKLAWALPRDRLEARLGADAVVASNALLDFHRFQSSQPALVRCLSERGISGPRYIAEIEKPAEEPLALLMADTDLPAG